MRGRAPGRRAAGEGLAARAGAACLLSLWLSAAAVSQERADSEMPTARGVFGLAPDTVRVGEPFTLGLAVRTEPGYRVRFPRLLPLGDDFEQRSPAETRRFGAGEWRVYYRLVAWRREPGDLPSIDVEIAGGDEVRTVGYRPPAVAVRSVLPGPAEEPALRPPRPPLERAGFPWLLFLGALVLVGGLAGLLLRGRGSGARQTEAAGTEEPAARALRELAELRRRRAAGELAGAAVYDALEAVLRRYAEATRGWRPGVPMTALADGDRHLAGALDRSALARFARLEARREPALAAIAATEAWVREDGTAGSEEGEAG